MTTFAVKSDLDAAHALLDLQSDQHGHVDVRGRRMDNNMESSTTIAQILSSIIGTTTVTHHPHTSTPKRKCLPKRLKELTKERKFVPHKKVCDQGTQTTFDLYLPEIEKMETIIKQLSAKIETFESRLKLKKRESSSISVSYERTSDVSIEEYSDTQRTRKSKKRKRILTTTSDFVSMIDKYINIYEKSNFNNSTTYAAYEIWDDITSHFEDFRGGGVASPVDPSRVFWTRTIHGPIG